MRLAAVYNVFDGEELLEGSIRQIRSLVDVVIVVYQITSNWGEHHPKLYITLKELQDANLVDHFEEHQILPREKSNYGGAGRMETAKRNKGIRIAREYGCSHYLLVDCDEYYIPDQFRLAKEAIKERPGKQTYLELATYFKKPTWEITPRETYVVPFIQELNKETDVWVGPGNTCVVADPTRTPIEKGPYMTITPAAMLMHHFSWVRRDISLKLRNSSANDNVKFARQQDQMIRMFNEFENEPGQTMPHYTGHTITEVPNQFNITYPFKKI